MDSSSTRRPYSLKWLIALSLGVVIIVVGVAISPHVKMYPAATCREKLHQLDEAASLWGADQTSDARATAADLQRYFKGGKLPVCESGGTYTFGSSELATRCSVHGRDEMGPQAPRAASGINQLLSNIFGRKTTASRNSCLSNLKQIDGAIQQWALEHGKHAEDSITNVEDITVYLKGSALPTCPQGGKYDVTTVGENPTCTVRGHKL